MTFKEFKEFILGAECPEDAEVRIVVWESDMGEDGYYPFDRCSSGFWENGKVFLIRGETVEANYSDDYYDPKEDEMIGDCARRVIERRYRRTS